MFDSDARVGAGQALSLVAAGLDALAGLEVAALSDVEIVALVKDIEVQARRLPAASHRLVAEMETRAWPGGPGCAAPPCCSGRSW